MGHTPGPWYANQDCIEIDGPEGPRDVTLAVVLQPDNAAADAHLIAAAPDLLTALKTLVFYLDDGEAEPGSALAVELFAAKAAITKALRRSE